MTAFPRHLLSCLPRAVSLAVCLAALLIASVVPGGLHAGGTPSVTVFAAASLKSALDEVAARYEAQAGGTVLVSYGGSSAMARQIEQGAPAQIFLSANPDWMDWLESAGLIAPDSRRDLLGNRLALVAAPDVTPPPEVAPGMDLVGALGDGRLAMALVQAVPAGIYGRAGLQALGLWDAVSDRVVQADNVRAALLLVSLGEAPLGIVYATDAAAEPGVRLVGLFPRDSHPPIIYPVAIVAEGDSPAARAFLAYLTGPEARAVFDRHGFSKPDDGS